jgi:hypothetical protein
MKIVLIEDRITRLEQFTYNSSIDLFARYSFLSIFPVDQIDLLKKDLQENSLDRVNNYDLIMAHKSAFTVTEAFNLDKITGKLIYFSGSISKSYLTNSPRLSVFLNSKDFYSANLIKFLDLILSKNIIEPSCLLYGDKWRLNLMINFLERITIIYSNFINQKSGYLIPEDFKDLINDRSIQEFHENEFINDLRKLSETGLLYENKDLLLNIINQIKQIIENKIRFES